MDSLTQLALGAAVGEAVAGRKLGNKAMVWGAVAGTIPDLDVLLNPWLSTVQQLSFHRSVTHSFLFALLAAPLLGWLLHRIYKKKPATTTDWTLLFILGFVTHALLDSCTTWGTQLFWPFSNYGVAFYNVFVIDPLYTLPLLIGLAVAVWYRRSNPKRRIWNTLGLAFSTAYLAFSFAAKANANNQFERSLQQQQISYQDYISKPTPLNTIFWSVTAKTEKGFYNGFYSLLDKHNKIRFAYEPQNSQLLEPYLGHPELERLLEITKGYYAVAKPDDGKGILIRDLRFGKFDGWQESGGDYVFVYRVWLDERGNLQVEEINNRPKVDRAYLQKYWNRIKGVRTE